MRTKRLLGVARLTAAISLTALILVTALPHGAFAAAAEEAATSPKVHELMSLLADPEIQKWLKEQDQKKSAGESVQRAEDTSISQIFDARLAAIRARIIAVAAAVPDLPNQFERSRRLVIGELG
jgi:hypothetical protein